jgi:putative transposase
VTTLEPKPGTHQGPEVGIDVGVTVPLALSDGKAYDHGEWLTEKEQAKLLRLEQRAAHRKTYRKRGEKALVRPGAAVRARDRRVGITAGARDAGRASRGGDRRLSDQLVTVGSGPS